MWPFQKMQLEAWGVLDKVKITHGPWSSNMKALADGGLEDRFIERIEVVAAGKKYPAKRERLLLDSPGTLLKVDDKAAAKLRPVRFVPLKDEGVNTSLVQSALHKADEEWAAEAQDAVRHKADGVKEGEAEDAVRLKADGAGAVLRIQCSAPPLAAEAASLIVRETLEYRRSLRGAERRGNLLGRDCFFRLRLHRNDR